MEKKVKKWCERLDDEPVAVYSSRYTEEINSFYESFEKVVHCGDCVYYCCFDLKKAESDSVA